MGARDHVALGSRLVGELTMKLGRSLNKIDYDVQRNRSVYVHLVLGGWKLVAVAQ